MRGTIRHTLLLALFLLPMQAYALKTLIIINNNSTEPSGPLRLVSSVPYDRQTLDAPPGVVSFTFSQGVKPDKSMIRVFDAMGSQVEMGELQVQGTMLSAALPPLTSGKYVIKWRARCLCAEDNEIGDSFHFMVR